MSGEIYERYLNPKLKKLSPYSPFAAENIRIRLDANESFFDLSPETKETLKKEIDNISFNRYPDVMCGKVIEKYSEIIKVNPKNIVAGNGSDELINVLVNSFLSKGDRIITFTPDFSMYGFYSEIIEAEVEYIAKNETDFLPDFDGILKKVKEENAKIVIFSNPCNPTGQLVHKNILSSFIEKCPCLVVVDEAYMDFCEDTKKYSFCNEGDFERYPNLIVLKTLSKAYGLASLRIGFLLSNEYYVNIIKMTKSPYNVNSISQKFAEIVLSDKNLLEEHRLKIIKNKNSLQREIKVILSDKNRFTIYDTFTDFVFIKTNEAKQIFEYLCKNGILVRNMGGKFLRITTGSEDENRILVEVLKEYVIT